VFEKYTEEARKAVFYARYEASQMGGSVIEIEHLLLGLLRACNESDLRVLRSAGTLEAVRERIQRAHSGGEKKRVSLELPLSAESRRALAHAAEEAGHLQSPRIGPVHLLLGIAHEPTTLAAEILSEHASVDRLRSMLEEGAKLAGAARPAHAFVGRAPELERVFRVLARRTRNNAVLVGEPGVGKSAIAKEAGRLIAAVEAPADLAGRTVIVLHPGGPIADVLANRLGPGWRASPPPVLVLDDLFEMPGAVLAEVAVTLEMRLGRRDVNCVATCTRGAWMRAGQDWPHLARHFEEIAIDPPNAAETLAILHGIKPSYEAFHRVQFAEGTLEAAIRLSALTLPERSLPDRAIDLLDDAGSRILQHADTQEEPGAAATLRAQLRDLLAEEEHAIMSHDFEAARKLDEQLAKLRAALRNLRSVPDAEPRVVTADDLAQTAAERIGVSRELLAQALEHGPGAAAGEVLRGHAWAPAFTAWLTNCRPAEAESLIAAIRLLRHNR